MKDIHLQNFQAFSRDFIGVSYNSFDCWDIVTLFHKKVFDHSIDLGFSYAGPGLRDENDKDWAKFSSVLISENKSKFKKVSKPQFGDIVLLRIYGLTAHVGVFIDNKTFLHTSKATGCMIDRLKKWDKRIEGYYRWQD